VMVPPATSEERGDVAGPDRAVGGSAAQHA
jgi:hypothetical protein